VEPEPEGEHAHVLARARMATLASQLECVSLDSAGGDGTEGGGGGDAEGLAAMAECRRSQLDEIECLQAMFVDEFAHVTPADALDSLREALDAAEEPVDEAALRAIAAHPPLEFALQLTCEGERAAAADAPPDGGAPTESDGGADDSRGKESIPLVASILVRVRLPARYPHATPVFAVEDAMVTTRAPLGKDKVLATAVMLREDELIDAMLRRAQEALPDPCVYEAAAVVTESAFEHVGQAWL
jgi:hypothetical protein